MQVEAQKEKLKNGETKNTILLSGLQRMIIDVQEGTASPIDNTEKKYKLIKSNGSVQVEGA